jgi:hypothetical protein
MTAVYNMDCKVSGLSPLSNIPKEYKVSETVDFLSAYLLSWVDRQT